MLRTNREQRISDALTMVFLEKHDRRSPV